jgi:hypothetical protein
MPDRLMAKEGGAQIQLRKTEKREIWENRLIHQLESGEYYIGFRVHGSVWTSHDSRGDLDLSGEQKLDKEITRGVKRKKAEAYAYG